MSDIEYEFGIPSAFGSDVEATAAMLHQAGFDSPEVRYDAVDIFPNDIELGADQAVFAGEKLPQFGPPFVKFVVGELGGINERLEKLMTDSLERWQFQPVTVVFVASMNTDASGNIGRNVQGNAAIYEPPPGFTLALHRLTISNSGNNFGNPFTAAAAYWELRVNDEMIDGGSLATPAANVVSGSLPLVLTRGTRDAPRVRDGQVLSLFMSAGPVSQKIVINGQGTLDRSVEA